ncbi:MAG: hypothetical protein QNK23_11840 [Crocinitomicaceae bacterium]|nr:hypothetical protein [Crocinitomicaceae bacterium]
MHLKNVLLLLLVACSFSLSSIAQVGTLLIKGPYSNEEIDFTHEYPVAHIFNESSEFFMVLEDYDINYQGTTIELPIGSYTIEIYLEEDYLAQTLRNIEIHLGEITDVTLSGITIYHYTEPVETQNSITQKRWVQFWDLNLATGNDFINRNPNFNSHYNIGYTFNSLYILSRNFSVGPIVGTNLNFTHFNKSGYIETSYEHKTERYMYWNLNAGFVFRIAVFNQYENDGWLGGVLDLGMKYNLPLLFKHVQNINGKTKVTTRGIHEYTDLSAFVRLGYSPITLTCEYRLTDFLQSPYHEQPRIKLGLSFLIPYYY